MRSMSRWSMIATSPLCSRLTSAFVRLPSRAVPRISATSTWSVRSAAAGTVATLGASCRVIARILRGFEQAFGVSPRHSVSLFGAQHPAQLIHELAAVELLDVALRELAQLLPHGAIELGSGAPARRAKLGRLAPEFRECPLEFQLELRRRLLEVREALALGPAAIRMIEHGLDRAAVLALQPPEQLETFL